MGINSKKDIPFKNKFKGFSILTKFDKVKVLLDFDFLNLICSQNLI